MMKKIRVAIYSDSDIIIARQEGRAFAEQAGFKGTDLTLITTVISEVARKIAEHPLPGEIVMSITRLEETMSITLIARIHLADKTMGLDVSPKGPPMDGFEISCTADETLLKWTQRLDGASGTPPALN